MKNNLFKRSLAIVMTVMMLMTCWVFMPANHEHLEADAAALEPASSLYNKSLLSGINTNVDYDVNTTNNYYKFKIYGNGDDGSDNTTARQQKYYKNLLSHDGDSSLVGDQNRGSYFSNVTNSELTVTIAYPTMVLKYDGQTTPKFGIMLEADASSGNKIRFERAWMDANSNGLSFNPNYWMGIAKDDSAFFYVMEGSAQKYLYAQDTSNGNVFSTRNNGQWEFLAASLEFTDSMSIGEWTRTISPTWKFYNGSTTYTGINNSTIYVMNFKGYGELLTQINNKKTELLNNADQYTHESIKTFVDAAKAITNLNPKNYTGINQATSWGSQMSTAYADYNTAVNGLQKRTYDVAYENLFSFSDWYYSNSSKYNDNSNVVSDVANGTITINNPDSDGYYSNGVWVNQSEYTTSATTGKHPEEYYQMPVEGGKTYYFTMKTANASSSEIFFMWKDVNGDGLAYPSVNFSGNGVQWAEFTAPADAKNVELRFDNNTDGTKITLSDIAVYEKSRADAIGIKEWTARPVKKSFTYNQALGSTLDVPARKGYKFNGWYLDNDADGVKDAGEEVTDGNGTVVSGTQSFAITTNYTLSSDWVKSSYDVGYDNLFSLADWAMTDSTAPSNSSRGDITYDIDAGTITAITTKDGEVYSNYGTAANHYQIAVEPNTEYVFTADVDLEGEQGQMFVFFYDASGAGVTGAIYNGATQSNPHIGLYVTNEGKNSITFTTPSNCTQMAIRVGATVVPTTATYSNIGFYKKEAYDAYAKNYSRVREVFTYGEAKALMANPTREGYVFDGWTLENGKEVTSTADLTESTTVYANWAKLYTVTYYDGDGTTVLAKVQVKGGEKVGSLPAVSPTKESTEQYSYTHSGWYANGKTFTKDTVITSDLGVFSTFDSTEHGNFTFGLWEEATCLVNATVTKRCGKCGYKFENVTYDPAEDTNAANHTDWVALGHHVFDENRQPESDYNETHHKIKCSNCSVTQEFVHVYEGNTSQGATCTQPGKIKQVCACGAERTIDGALDSENHVNKTLINVKAPTCEEDGYTGDTYCNDCEEIVATGKVDTRLGHSFTSYASDGNATCTADGTKTAKCDRCDATDTKTDEGSMIDHKYTNYVYNKDAKCGVDGTKTAECDTCDTGATDTITAAGTALAHVFNGEIKNNNDGTHSYKCTNTGCDVYGGTVDCNYGDWDTSGAEQHVKTCEDCGYQLKEYHNFTDWKSTEPNKEADGQHSKTCTECGKVVTEDCNYTRTSYAVTCTTDGITKHSCQYCGHSYTTTDKGKTGHNYTAEAGVRSYNNGQHSFKCANGCNTFGYAGQENGRALCDYDYANVEAGTHKATCAYCKYSTTEACSGGEASCTTLKVCTKCNKEYGVTDPHSFTGPVVKLDGDEHAYLCAYCKTAGLYGVGAVEGAKEACSGGSATCNVLAVCDKCGDTHGDYAAHTFNGTPVVLEGDVHAYRCSVCKNQTLYGVGNVVNATEACAGGTATCSAKAKCTVCGDDHGEVDAKAHKWGEWTNVESTETHKRVCEYNNDHIETTNCEASGQTIVEADCEAEGYTLNTCDFCNHEWKTNIVAPLTHKWGAWVSDNKGNHTRTCEREGCHYEDDHTAKTDTVACSKENATSVVTAPTCLDEGFTTYTCKDCGYSWEDDFKDATGHSFTEKKKSDESKYFRQAKDCVTPETYWYRCDNCAESAATEKDNYENEADLYWVSDSAAGHVYSAQKAEEKYLATKATCTAKATYYYSCSACGESSKDTASEKTFADGNALGHDWQNTKTDLKTAADCINDAVYYKECSRCKISSRGETDETWVDANTKTGHDFDHDAGYTKGVAATCTKEGVVEHYTCEVCGKHFQADKTTEIAANKLVIKKLGHDYIDIDAKPATCEEDGYTEHSQCQRCNYRNTLYQEIKASGHDFKAENGYYVDTVYNYHAYKCSNCDAVGVDGVKYAVDFSEIDLAVVGGIKCEFTGEYVNYEDANGIHSHKLSCVCGNVTSAACADSVGDYTAAECGVNAYYTYICETCGYDWVEEVADSALEHNFDDAECIKIEGEDKHTRACVNGCGETETEACSTAKPSNTCGQQNFCDDCGAEFGEKIPHQWTQSQEEAYLMTAATCETDAVYYKKCASCNTKDEKQIWILEGSRTGHSMTEEFVYDITDWQYKPEGFNRELKEPTCNSEGLSISYCENCDYYVTNIESKNEDLHEFGEETLVGGTCGTGMTYKQTCKNCGKTVTRVDSDVDHEYVLQFKKAATCEEDSVELYMCKNCGDTDETHETKKLGHTWGELIVDKAATCKNAGRGYYICTVCGAKSENEVIAKISHAWDLNNDGLIDEGFTPDSKDNSYIYVAATNATCTTDGYEGYFKCLDCSYDQHSDERWLAVEGNLKAAAGHVDTDGDGECDGTGCTKDLSNDSTDECGCVCHKTNWFSKIIYKILKIFWKLFGIGKSCDCGTVHY